MAGLSISALTTSTSFGLGRSTLPRSAGKVISRQLVHLLIRRLVPHDGGEDAPAVTIFLSHTKLDLEHEPRVVKALLAHLTATQAEKTWFDSGDIASGSRFAKEIERGVADAALLAVVTDSYSSRSWCRREVLFAKRHQRQLIVVDSIQHREVRSFAYVGNVPVLRWKGHPQDAVDLLLRETLRHAHAVESLKQRQRPGDCVLPAGPELVTLVHRDKAQSILYPDPPLGPEELAVLEATGIRVETPLERHAHENQLAGKGLVVTLSVSEAEDIARFGLRKPHMDALFLELSRYLLLAGIRLAYGGHLRANGYTIRLADLLSDPIVEYLRGKSPSTLAPPPELFTYVPWPMAVSVRDEARLGALVEVRRCERPVDVDEGLDGMLVAEPPDDLPFDAPARRFAWARGLTEMRRRQTQETSARVIVGGRIGPGGDAYKGRIPGVLEEALLSIQSERPVYLIGAFGGCARMVVDALEGRIREELSWKYQSVAPYSEEVRTMYKDRGQAWQEYDEIVRSLQTCGMVGLKNGLTIEENRELAETRSTDRIVELLLRGLNTIHQVSGNPS